MKRNYSKRNGHNRKKASALLTSLIVLICVAVASTLAVLIAIGGPIKNIFLPSDVSIEVEETFDYKVKEDVSIKNTGKTEAYIRAAIIVTWKDGENGNVYAGQPVEKVDYTISLYETGWFKGTDGFYYCKTPVAPGASTPDLIERCEPIAGRTPDGFDLNVEILGSAIQSVPANAVKDAWGITADQFSQGGAEQ